MTTVDLSENKRKYTAVTGQDNAGYRTGVEPRTIAAALTSFNRKGFDALLENFSILVSLERSMLWAKPNTRP